MATDAATLIATARSWIGTPYVHQASVKGAGCDCIGLLRGVWREIHGCDDPEILPPYAPDWAEATGEETLYLGLKRHFSEISLPEISGADVPAGAVVLFRMIPRGPAKHCALVAALNGVPSLIHTRMNKQVSEEPFSDYWRRRLAYAFEVV